MRNPLGDWVLKTLGGTACWIGAESSGGMVAENPLREWVLKTFWGNGR